MAHGRPSSVVGLVSGGVLEPKVPAGPKLHRVPGSSFRPGSTPWALHPLVVAEGDAPEFPEKQGNKKKRKTGREKKIVTEYLE